MSGLHKSVRAGSNSDGVVRVHLIAGGFPVGSAAGHDHDWIRTQLTSMLTTDAVGVQLSHAMDFSDVEKYLPVRRLFLRSSRAVCSAVLTLRSAAGAGLLVPRHLHGGPLPG